MLHSPFFFSSRVPHRGLHSFPTRRSSDLLEDLLDLADALVGARREQCGGEQARANRSEEHTSELQSRRDLVCRLLLEKKNPPALDMPAAVYAPDRATGRAALRRHILPLHM